MEREILFRGKRSSDGVWEYGFYYAKPILEKHFILLGENQWLVEKESVSQFTGLYDKNGNQIFEGDILKYQMNIKTAIVGKVAFVCGAFVFESEELERECDIAFSSFADDEISFPQHCIEVIGNVHDNPELLEGGVEGCG